MSELRDYQRKAISSNKKVVFCNWKRESGKSQAMAYEIYNDYFRLIENKNVIVISGASANIECKILYDLLRELFTEEIVDIKVYKDKIEITNRRNKVYTVKFISSLNFECTRGLGNVDKAYCDEFIPSKSEIECILGFAKQVKIFTTYVDNEDFEYISDVENKIDKKEWISNQIEELMMEYSSIPKAENTTMRREKVLLQIKMLQDVFDIK